MTGIEIGLLVLFVLLLGAVIYMNNAQHAKYAALITAAEARITDAVHGKTPTSVVGVAVPSGTSHAVIPDGHHIEVIPPAVIDSGTASTFTKTMGLPPAVKGLVRGQGLNPGVADPYAGLTDAQWASISAGKTADDMYGYFNDNAADQKGGQASAQGITGTGTKMTDAQIAAQAADTAKP